MKRKALIALCAAAGLMAPTGIAAMAPTMVYAATNPVLHVGSRGSAVKQLQSKLNALGFKVGTADGVFGSQTRSAVESFQRSRHLSADGVVGAATWAALNSAKTTGSAASKTTDRKPTASSSPSKAPRFPGTLKYGSRGTAVKELQNQLNKLHFNCGKADGDFGPATRNAVKAFEKAHHLTQDGVVSSKVWSALFAPTSSTPPSSRGGSPLPKLVYTAYRVNNSKIGSYSTLSAAETAVHSSPGGYVKDSSGKVRYTQSRYAVYDSPASAPQYTTSLTTANSDIARYNDGFVVDLTNNIIATRPRDYFYYSSGNWDHHGVDFNNNIYTESTGTSHPNWAAANALYVAPVGSPPYYDNYYQIQDGSGHASIKHMGTFENPFRDVDLRYPAPSSITGAVLNSWFVSNQSPIQGLGNQFIAAQATYSVNAAYLASHAFQETGPSYLASWKPGGIAHDKNNLFGYGAYDASAYSSSAAFPSTAYSIDFEAWFVRESYLNDGAIYRYQWPTLDGMNRYYASDTNWSTNIAHYMEEISTDAKTPSTSFTAYSASKTAPSSKSDAEPTFYFPATSSVHATGKTISKSVTALSDYQMRPELKQGAQGYWVKQMQSVIGVPQDGDFGSQTNIALKAFQQKHGLAADGDCGPQTWAVLFPATPKTIGPSTSVYVDQMRLGDGAVEWYHVLAFNGTVLGWVNASDLTLTNVYRVMPSTGYSLAVGGGTVHLGDYVVYMSGNVYYANGASGTVLSGAVPATELVQVSH